MKDRIISPSASLRKRRRWYAGDGDDGATMDPPADKVTTAPKPDNPKPEDDKPQGDTFPRSYVEELRAENASWRTKVRDLEKKFEDMETEKQKTQAKELEDQNRFKELYEQEQQKTAQLETQMKEQQAEIQRVKIAAEFHLPDDLAERLQGEDETALRADAQKLAKYAPKPDEAAPDADPDKEPDKPDKEDKSKQDAGRRSTTTAAPGGPPMGRTDADRRAQYFSGRPQDSPMFKDIDVILPPQSEG